MNNRIVRALIIVVTIVVLNGCNTITTADTRDNGTYVDMNTVTIYSGTAIGLQLNMADGNGYYLEVAQDIKDNMVQIYHIESENDYDNLMDVLETRDGRVIIEVSNGTITDNEGNGVDSSGYYRKYDIERFRIGDEVQSVFIYNPDNNCVDDILYRLDSLIE